MKLTEQVREQLTDALKKQADVEVGTLRLLISALEYKRMQKNADLTSEEEIAVVKSEVKKRQEAAGIYREHNEPARAAAEEAELVILEKFMPVQIGEQEVRETIRTLRVELGADADKGQLIGKVIAKLGKGAVDGSLVARLVNEKE